MAISRRKFLKGGLPESEAVMTLEIALLIASPLACILQFVTWPISIFQAGVDKNPSAPTPRLHFVMTAEMLGGREGTGKGQPPSSPPCPQPSSSSSMKEGGGRESHPASPSLLALLALVPGIFRLSLPMNAHQRVPCQ